MQRFQTLGNYWLVTWEKTPSLPPVKCKKNTLDMSAPLSPHTPDALDAAAEQLEVEARRLRRKARQARDRLEQARAHARKSRLGRDIARAMLIDGKPFGTVSHAVAAATGARIDTAIHWTEKEARTIDKDARARRNEAIMRMKAQGDTNARIAQKLAMHEKSVARIVGQMRRKKAG